MTFQYTSNNKEFQKNFKYLNFSHIPYNHKQKLNIHNFLLKLKSIRCFIVINNYIHLYDFSKRENLEENFNNYIHAIYCIIFK